MESRVSPLRVVPGSKAQASGRNSQQISTRSNFCDVCGLGPAPTRFLEHPLVFSRMEELMQSAQNGCRACASIHHFLISQPHTDTTLTYHLAASHLTPQLSTEVAPSSNHTPRDFEFFTVDHTLTGRQQSNFDPVSKHPIIRRMSEPSGNTSSAKCFNTLMEWISRCQKEHTLCNSTTEENLPHRILKIQCLRPLRVRVVEGGSRHGEYACLSYRWGPNTKLTSLNRGNLSIYKAMIPRRRFSPLVRDAITIAAKLNLRFIWIDAYCILQDSKEDWEKEAARMGSIYEHAFLTISATDSESGRAIFSTKKSRSFPVTEVNGEPVFIRKMLHHPCQPLWDGESLSGSTLERAWVYQERLLSRRFVHFIREEIFWECRESTWCECGSRSEAWAQLRAWKPRMIHNQDWELIAAQYNLTKLTYEDDRLPALAGVASRFAEIHGKTYLAGHWEEDLPLSLAWTKSSIAEPRPLHQTAPTWSWASLPRGEESRLSFIGLMLPTVRLLGYNRKQPGADIYAGGKQTEIKVEGHVLDMKIYKQKPRFDDELGDLLGKAGQASLTIRPDFDMDPEDHLRYQAVPDGTLCSFLLFDRSGESRSNGLVLVGILLLQRITTDSKTVTFERIGWTDNGMLNNKSHLDQYEILFDPRVPDPFRRVKRNGPSPVPLAWLWERAEKRQITLV